MPEVLVLAGWSLPTVGPPVGVLPPSQGRAGPGWAPAGGLGSSTEGVQVHFDLLPAAQHPDGGVQASRRDGHLPSAHQLPVPGEERLNRGSKQSQAAGSDSLYNRFNHSAMFTMYGTASHRD